MPHTDIQILPLRARKGIFARILTVVTALAARRHDRQRLGKLDTHLLRDIGLEAHEARQEAAKPFWQP